MAGMMTTTQVAEMVSKERGRAYSRQAVAMAIADKRLRASTVGDIYLVDEADARAFARLQESRERIRKARAKIAKKGGR